MNMAVPAPALDPNLAPRASTLLRFFTCGSVDDGKSTLIGRLLYETGAVFEDQLEALERDSKKFGTQGASLDYALLLDGLSAEREQGITIDVAYRYFSSKKRAFIVADTPGHEQYTRNMATGASTAELAIILIDARKGILPQTRRHSYIVSMLGVRSIVLAVNKMDLVDFSQARFDEIVAAYKDMAKSLGFATITAIPISARDGDNITTSSARTPWYRGPALLTHLETVEPFSQAQADEPFAMPVQWVNRPDLDFRGYAGTIASGAVTPGMEIMVLPGARRAVISRIVTSDGDKQSAGAGESITLTLDREIDASRGDVISSTAHKLSPRRTFTARVLWMIDEHLAPGRDYIIQQATAGANARVAALHHMIDVETFAEKPADELAMNQIGLITLSCDKPLIVANYRGNRDLGAFILIDRLTNQTAALGTIDLDAAQRLDAPTFVTQPASTLLTRIAGEPGTKARSAFSLRASLEIGAAITLAIIVGLLTASLIVSIAVLVFDLVARTMIHAISANGGAGKTSIDEANESGAGI
jgi:bifunctional enzyme CysN/CysC